jgi:hypothetical protein
MGTINQPNNSAGGNAASSKNGVPDPLLNISLEREFQSRLNHSALGTASSLNTSLITAGVPGGKRAQKQQSL